MHEGIQSPGYSQVIRGDWQQEKSLPYHGAPKWREHIQLPGGSLPHDREGGPKYFPSAGITCAAQPPKWHGPQGPEAKNMLTDAHRNAKMADQEPHSGQYNLWNTIGEDGKVCVWVGGIGPTHPEQYRNGCQSHQSAGLLQRLGLSTQFLGNRLHMLAVPSLMLPQNCFWAQNMADLWLMNGA